tara:strand:+ start:4760 stop:5437 length:678 start_codon:yes stop_codon:yes gene_type:complete
LKKIIIAIDGDSSSGKSTLAKALAKKISFKHINTGSMYRAVTHFALLNGLINNDKLKTEEIIKLTETLDFNFKIINQKSFLFVNNINVEKKIKLPIISNHVSQVSTIYEIRKKIVSVQREIGLEKDIVMEGRDIGSVVFPNAELKFFITADINIRAERRYKELKSINIFVDKKDVIENIKQRDYIDKNRDHSPLIMCKDSILIDNSNLGVQDQIKIIIDYIKKKY